MRRITADWIYPASAPPLRHGVVVMDDHGQIIDLKTRAEFDAAELEFHHGILCPGFINAQCHLELSHMKGKINEHTGLTGFISEFIQKRNEFPDQAEQFIRLADEEMIAAGIVAVGDISNTDISFLQKSRSSIRYHTFIECFGLIAGKANEYFTASKDVFDEAMLYRLMASITPHAPYSVTDELFEAIFSFRQNAPAAFSYHNQESDEENKWSRGESSRFDDFYAKLNLPAIRRYGESSMKANAPFFPKNSRVLFVHNTYSSAADFQFATDEIGQGVFFCTCPRANLYIENRLPDYSFWKKYPDRICIGTDSYASNHQLSILEEMKTIQTNDRSVTLEELIRWSTRNGADFFGWQNALGTLEPGKTPGINLITGVDPEFQQLTAASRVKRLV